MMVVMVVCANMMVVCMYMMVVCVIVRCMRWYPPHHHTHPISTPAKHIQINTQNTQTNKRTHAHTHTHTQTQSEVQIKLVETRDHILSMYDKQISEYTEKHFNRENIQLLLNKMVQRVDKDGLQVKNQDGSSSFIEAGTMVWCTGRCIWGGGSGGGVVVV